MQNILIDIALGIRIAMGPWAYPPLSALVVLLVSFIISMTSNLINRRFIDYERLGRARQEIKKWQDMKKQAQQETDPRVKRKLDMKVKRRERYVMKLQTETSKQSFLPMMITIVPFFLVFAIMNGVFVDPFTFPGQVHLGPVVYSPLNFAQILGGLGLGFGWQFGQWPLIPLGGMGLFYMYWYIICSFTLNLIIQKFLGTSMTTGM